MDKDDRPRSAKANYFLEFLVVFLGVTISFWLNEWNERRKTTELHKEDVVSLLEDLEKDEERLSIVLQQSIAGEERSARLIAITESYRSGDYGYDAFVDSLIGIGYVSGYGTFFMNSATYKSLIGSTRIQEFPRGINKQIRDYYEYVSKRVEDNNDIVDDISLEYYNVHHPYCQWLNHSKERPDSAACRAFFAHGDTRSHYSELTFYHQTMALHDRTAIHANQIRHYQSIRNALDSSLVSYGMKMMGDRFGEGDGALVP